MKKIFFLWVIFFSFSVQAGEAAKNSGFAFSPAWLAMVHYRPQLFGGYEGTIDSETFYLAPEGRISPMEPRFSVGWVSGPTTAKAAVQRPNSSSSP